MTTFTEADLLNALRDCFVPALRRDVVSANLVRAATLPRAGSRTSSSPHPVTRRPSTPKPALP